MGTRDLILQQTDKRFSAFHISPPLGARQRLAALQLIGRLSKARNAIAEWRLSSIIA
jgi:hypothetical protein